MPRSGTRIRIPAIWILKGDRRRYSQNEGADTPVAINEIAWATSKNKPLGGASSCRRGGDPASSTTRHMLTSMFCHRLL
jgi:hypothetical protein